VAATMVDSLGELPLTAPELEQRLTWRPLLNFLLNRDPEAAAGLNAEDKAVAAQRWGSAPKSPAQRLERAYLHGEELWVELVFEPFVTLGPGITDSDEDGFKELFARVDPRHLGAGLPEDLREHYIAPRFSTLGLRDIVKAAESALYSATNPEVIGIIGEPFEVPGFGTLAYPFVVLQANANDKTVAVLVAP